MGNDWFHEYFINELKAIGRKPTSNMQHEVVDSLPSSGNEQTIYFVKNDSSSSNNHYDEYVWISSSSTFEKIGSTQPDWSQNDATQPDYVKNRPFYTGDPVETVLVEETTLTFEKINGAGGVIYAARFETTFLPIVGETYKVSWDGTVYESTCAADSGGTLAIGNPSIIGAGSDTGEPFLLVQESPGAFDIGTTDTSASHTISISGMVTPVVKIDPKYLDKPDWDQNDVTASSYIKNRPFYTGDPVETVLVEERTLAFAEDGGVYTSRFQSTIEATVGETYKVSWDGIVYECICVLIEGMHVFGNLSIMDVGSDTGEPFLMGVDKSHGTVIITTADTASSHTISISCMVTPVVKIDAKYLSMPFKPYGESYLTFSSPSSFTLSVYNNIKSWDGTLEYFASDETWTIWEGTSPLSAAANGGEYVLYLRGTGNTVITGDRSNIWVLTGTGIKCIGNIENLLDYVLVASGAHPTMSENCYSYMFQNCTSLTQAPALPATTLAAYCYNRMFAHCTSLTQAPALPATTLAAHCYDRMFQDCTSLTQAPALPATTLADGCYNCMFQNCTSLKLSSTKTDEYTQKYRIPSSGDGTTVAGALNEMFASTGGTFNGTPSINTTYYLSSDNMIVRETEIATLNGYVGSMIDAAISEYADTAEYIIPSSTEGSTKKFKITVDDSGTISATEVI